MCSLSRPYRGRIGPVLAVEISGGCRNERCIAGTKKRRACTQAPICAVALDRIHDLRVATVFVAREPEGRVYVRIELHIVTAGSPVRGTTGAPDGGEMGAGSGIGNDQVVEEPDIGPGAVAGITRACYRNMMR